MHFCIDFKVETGQFYVPNLHYLILITILYKIMKHLLDIYCKHCVKL